MRKKLLLVAMSILLIISLMGCGAKEEDAGDKVPEIDKDFSLQITDSYTFTDPQDLDFNQRYVLIGDENCKLLNDMQNFGYEASAMYEILYSKDDVPVGEYQFFVCADEAGASELNEFYSSQGQKVTQENNVLYSYTDGDTLEGNFITFSEMKILTDETSEAYIEMMKTSNGLRDYE